MNDEPTGQVTNTHNENLDHNNTGNLLGAKSNISNSYNNDKITTWTWCEDSESYFLMSLMNCRWVRSSSSVTHLCSLCCSRCCVSASSSRNHAFSWHSRRTCDLSFCFSDSMFCRCPANETITCNTAINAQRFVL